jgi:hypothetical protein
MDIVPINVEEIIKSTEEARQRQNKEREIFFEEQIEYINKKIKLHASGGVSFVKYMIASEFLDINRLAGYYSSKGFGVKILYSSVQYYEREPNGLEIYWPKDKETK